MSKTTNNSAHLQDDEVRLLKKVVDEERIGYFLSLNANELDEHLKTMEETQSRTGSSGAFELLMSFPLLFVAGLLLLDDRLWHAVVIAAVVVVMWVHSFVLAAVHSRYYKISELRKSLRYR